MRATLAFAFLLLAVATAASLEHRLARRLRAESDSSWPIMPSVGVAPFTPASGWFTGEVLGGIKVRGFNQPEAGPTEAEAPSKNHVGKWYYKNLKVPARDKQYDGILAAGAKVNPKDRTHVKRFVIHTTEGPNFSMNRLHSKGWWTHFMIGRAVSSQRTGPVFILQTLPLTVDGHGTLSHNDGAIQIDVVGTVKEGVMQDPEVLAAIKAVFARVNQFYPTVPLKVDSANCISFERAACNSEWRPLNPPASMSNDYKNWVGVMGHMHLEPAGRYDPGVFDVMKILPANAPKPTSEAFSDPASKCYTKAVAAALKKVSCGCKPCPKPPKAPAANPQKPASPALPTTAPPKPAKAPVTK